MSVTPYATFDMSFDAYIAYRPLIIMVTELLAGSGRAWWATGRAQV